MKTTCKFIDAENTNVSMTITMRLCDWINLRDCIRTDVSYGIPAMLKHNINDLIDKMSEEFVATEAPEPDK